MAALFWGRMVTAMFANVRVPQAIAEVLFGWFLSDAMGLGQVRPAAEAGDWTGDAKGTSA
ncbi:hypothetical protein [Streptomyces sp. NRRL S-813]|uniref:hypothetical protein n=1 Tax=Streptomyces sp. NRRL S-813 TaxID=1463919 RepID=UPI00131B1FD0|nr:hypothetical protein [Streptomyces sp. NRRL S-813]